ncbi:DUF975 family protein [Persicirhabdus sediminis]|uniref:DUF975 family protein n=1 Tax=Persicirhabdus sediminis TaxID=454144 RepID=A0A8J7SKA8_9BACT|nr:DUF975 family protein [Persicirhabdus sediminis]MBK1789678.1 DUF975 family protein [Persicirhabdus sediminis]
MSKAKEEWFYAKGGTQDGPVSLQQLQSMIKGNRLNPDQDLVWKKGMAEWVKPNSLKEFTLASPPAAPATKAPKPAKKQKKALNTQPSADPYSSPEAQIISEFHETEDGLPPEPVLLDVTGCISIAYGYAKRKFFTFWGVLLLQQMAIAALSIGTGIAVTSFGLLPSGNFTPPQSDLLDEAAETINRANPTNKQIAGENQPAAEPTTASQSTAQPASPAAPAAPEVIPAGPANTQPASPSAAPPAPAANNAAPAMASTPAEAPADASDDQADTEGKNASGLDQIIENMKSTWQDRQINNQQLLAESLISAAMFILPIYLTLGFLNFCLHLVKGQQAGMLDLFTQAGRVLAVLVGYILFSFLYLLPLIVAGAFIAVLLSIGLPSITDLGIPPYVLIASGISLATLTVVIPTLLIFVRCIFFPLAIIEYKMGAIAGLIYSWKITKGNWWRLFGLNILAQIVIFLGALCFGIGLLWAIPTATLSYIIAYRYLQGGWDKVVDPETL